MGLEPRSVMASQCWCLWGFAGAWGFRGWPGSGISLEAGSGVVQTDLVLEWEWDCRGGSGAWDHGGWPCTGVWPVGWVYWCHPDDGVHWHRPGAGIHSQVGYSLHSPSPTLGCFSLGDRVTGNLRSFLSTLFNESSLTSVLYPCATVPHLESLVLVECIFTHGWLFKWIFLWRDEQWKLQFYHLVDIILLWLNVKITKMVYITFPFPVMLDFWDWFSNFQILHLLSIISSSFLLLFFLGGLLSFIFWTFCFPFLLS